MQKLVKRSTAGCPQSDLQHELHVAGRDQMPVELTASCSNLSYKQKKRRGMSMNRPADSYKGLLVEQLWHLACFTEQEQGFLAECYPTHHNSPGVGSWNRIIHACWCVVVSWSVYIQTETVVNSGELPASTPTVWCWALNCLLDFRPCWTAPTCRARQQLCFFSLCPCHLYASVVTGSLQSPIYKQAHSNS